MPKSYRRVRGYATDHLIDSLDDGGLLMHMGVPPRYIPIACKIHQEDLFPPEIQEWISWIPNIFRPSVAPGTSFDPELFGMGLVLYGPAGGGKTTMASALLLRLVRMKIENVDPTGRNFTWFGAAMGLFVDWQEASELFRQAVSSEEHKEEAEELRDLMRPDGPVTNRGDFLVLDDIGRERTTEFNLNELHRVLRIRYNDCFPTIITTNTPPKKWAEVYGPVLAPFLERSTARVEVSR